MTTTPREDDVRALEGEIANGDFDQYIKRIRDAINERDRKRKQDVLDLVHEVYGDNYVIQTSREGTFARSGTK